MERMMKITVFGFALLLAAGIGQANAAGGIETASAGELEIEVSTSCHDGDAVFKVTNHGEAFSKPVVFSTFQTTSNTAISKRRMKLAAGQAATFKVRNADEIARVNCV